MIEYTNIPEVDRILTEAEEILMEDVGRFQAQRLISILSQLPNTEASSTEEERQSRNIYLEIFEAGKKAGGHP